MIRRSESSVSLRSNLPNHNPSRPVRQYSNLSATRSDSLQSRQTHAKIERANSGLAAAKIATGAQSPVKLTTETLKTRKSMGAMKSAAQNGKSLSSLKKSPSFIKEESPSQFSKDVSKIEASISTKPKTKIGLYDKKNDTIAEQKKENGSQLFQQPQTVQKNTLKITPIKVGSKTNSAKQQIGEPKNTKKNAEEKEFLKFQETTEIVLKEEKEQEELKLLNSKTQYISSQSEAASLSAENLTKVPSSKDETVRSNEADETVRSNEAEDTVNAEEIIHSVLKSSGSGIINKTDKDVEETTKPQEIEGDNAVNIQKESSTSHLNEVEDKNTNLSADSFKKENAVDEVVSLQSSTHKEDDKLSAPVINLTSSEEHLKAESPTKNGSKIQVDSRESFYHDSYETIDFKPPQPDFFEKPSVENNPIVSNDGDEDKQFITPIKEKPLKSAFRSKSKYESNTSEKKDPKKAPVVKNLAQDAYLKLTTAENTRLNSQLQDENQRKSKIVRSPSRRLSLRAQPPSAGNMKTGSSMSQRMKPSPLNNGQNNYVYREKTQPIMNITLEAPELTPLERKSSFERAPVGKKLGFGHMSMRESDDAVNGSDEYNTDAHSSDYIKNFKSRFVDSDDEFDTVPAGNTNNKHVSTMRTGNVPKKSSAFGRDAQQAGEVSEPKKKGFGVKIKKLFGKKK